MRLGASFVFRKETIGSCSCGARQYFSRDRLNIADEDVDRRNSPRSASCSPTLNPDLIEHRGRVAKRCQGGQSVIGGFAFEAGERCSNICFMLTLHLNQRCPRRRYFGFECAPPQEQVTDLAPGFALLDEIG